MKMPSFRQTILLVGTPPSSPWAVRAISAEPAQTAGAAETAAEAAADANLPGGGNADAAGQNVDHQFEGVE